MCACVCLCVRVCACVSVCTGVKPPYRGGVVAGDGHQKSTSPAEGRESQSLAGEVLQTLDREGLQDINAGITRTHRHTHIPRPGRTDTHKRARTDSVRVCACVLYLHLCLVGLLCVESEGLPRPCSSSSPCPLLRWCFSDDRHQQRLHPDTGV